MQIGDYVQTRNGQYRMRIIGIYPDGFFDAEDDNRNANLSTIYNQVMSSAPPKIYRRLNPIEFINENGEDMATTKKPEPKIDFTQLDPLVIDQGVKDEIIAVLKQHSNIETIFKKWGLDEIIKYGKGMTFMFYGPPGTGKTWAAHCIANAMGRELLVVGSAEIQTSEPGGANRNIKAAFKEAKKSKKVLFLDECDSLITLRNDVGMILSSEINTLLTEIENFEGIAILATNRIDSLDPALERRISLIVEFPEPDVPARKTIWKKMLPEKMPLEKGLTPEKLAEFNLTGAQIKNVILQAARLAAAAESKFVGYDHFESAINRILQSKNLMGTASRYRQVHAKEEFGVGKHPVMTKVEPEIKVDVVPEIDRGSKLDEGLAPKAQ